MPKCPLCGGKSTWVQFPSDRLDLRSKFPDECEVCRAEDDIHWKQWAQGIDVTQFGGGPITESGHRVALKGLKVA